MPLITIEYGSLASSEVMNDNFSYLDNRITSVSGNLTSATSSINSSIASMNSTISGQIEDINDDIDDLETSLESLQSTVSSLSFSPDYSNATTVSYTSGDAVGFDGWLQIYVTNWYENGTSSCSINGITVASCTGGSQGGIPAQDSNMVIVSKDDIVTFSGAGRTFYKIPFVS